MPKCRYNVVIPVTSQYELEVDAADEEDAIAVAEAILTRDSSIKPTDIEIHYEDADVEDITE